MGHDLMWRLAFTKPSFFLQMRFRLIETNEPLQCLPLPCLNTLNLITQKALNFPSIYLS